MKAKIVNHDKTFYEIITWIGSGIYMSIQNFINKTNFNKDLSMFIKSLKFYYTWSNRKKNSGGLLPDEKISCKNVKTINEKSQITQKVITTPFKSKIRNNIHELHTFNLQPFMENNEILIQILPQDILSNTNKKNKSEKKYQEIHFPNEEKILQIPYSFLEIILQENESSKFVLQLKILEVPIYDKIIIWVDDQKEQNYKYLAKFKGKKISFVFCESTNECIIMLKNFKWLLILEESEMCIISDMTRYEKISKTNNQFAGLELFKLINDYIKLNLNKLIFTNDKKKVEKMFKEDSFEDAYVLAEDNKELFKFIDGFIAGIKEPKKLNKSCSEDSLKKEKCVIF